MVATDYVKYLELYNKKELFNIYNWIKLIQDDLNAEGKVWISDEEHASQLAILQKFMANLNIDDIEGVFLEGNNADTKYIVAKWVKTCWLSNAAQSISSCISVERSTSRK